MIKKFLRHSLPVQAWASVCAIALLCLVSAVSSGVLAWISETDAQAINTAGSVRMAAYRINFQLATDFSDIDLNHIQSNHIFETDGKDMIQNRKHYERVIKDNIEYALTYQESRISGKDVGNIIDIMVDVCILPDDATIKVNGISLPIGIVRERFMEITSMHIDYIIDSLKENPSDVRNIRSYLITTIFNAPTTLSQYYRAKVNHDFSSGAFYKGGDTCKSR